MSAVNKTPVLLALLTSLCLPVALVQAQTPTRDASSIENICDAHAPSQSLSSTLTQQLARGQKAWDQRCYQQAETLLLQVENQSRLANQVSLEFDALVTLADIYDYLTNPSLLDRVVERMELLIPKSGSVRDRANMAMAQAHQMRNKKQHKAAVDALSLLIEGPDNSAIEPSLKARLYTARSDFYWRLGEEEYSRQCIHDAQAAITILTPMTNKKNHLGIAYFRRGRCEQSNVAKLPYFDQGLELCQQAGDVACLLSIHNNYAIQSRELGRYQVARKHYQQALDISRLYSFYDDTGMLLGNLANLERLVGQPDVALRYLEESILLNRKYGTSYGLSYRLSTLGELLIEKKEYERAILALREALTIREQSGYTRHIPTVARNLGNALVKIGRRDEAIKLWQQALEIAVKDNNVGSVAMVTIDMSHYVNVSDRDLFFAVDTAKSLGDVEMEWSAFQALTQKASQAGLIDQAIFFGKQAINTLQKVRASNATLDKATQKSLLQKNEESYKSLADLLFGQGRLVEGQQVLAMLKEAEYFDFVQRSSAVDPRKTQADYTAQERPWSLRYDTISTQLAALSKEYDALLKKAKAGQGSGGGSDSGTGGGLTQQEQQRKDQLDADLTLARQAFEAFMADLKREFTQSASAERQQEFGEKNLASLRALQGTLRDLSKLGSSGAVTLHYLMTDKRLWILLTTPTVQLKREAAITEKQLNLLIGQYRDAIASRSPHIKELGKALYDVLIAPVAKDLAQEKAQTLMLSLDGSLRYLPMAALFDGEKFLAQRYRLALFTEAAKDKLKDKPQATWSLAGYGLTQKIENFDALPSVQGELDGILQGMRGSVKFNNDFTARAFKAGLEDEPPVVHLASHFVFKSGNETDSFLLMGDGSKLSLQAIKDGYQFTNLDLLTLSACETAVGGGKDANGREVEGFGALAQNQGAKGVIATLWPVADQSTGQFMQLFYGYRQQNPGMTKAQAMQMAQNAFIEGKVQTSLAQVRRSAQPVGGGATTATAVTTTDHPYYWAPFILMGNWL